MCLLSVLGGRRQFPTLAGAADTPRLKSFPVAVAGREPGQARLRALPYHGGFPRAPPADPRLQARPCQVHSPRAHPHPPAPHPVSVVGQNARSASSGGVQLPWKRAAGGVLGFEAVVCIHTSDSKTLKHSFHRSQRREADCERAVVHGPRGLSEAHRLRAEQPVRRGPCGPRQAPQHQGSFGKPRYPFGVFAVTDFSCYVSSRRTPTRRRRVATRRRPTSKRFASGCCCRGSFPRLSRLVPCTRSLERSHPISNALFYPCEDLHRSRQCWIAQLLTSLLAKVTSGPLQ